VSVEGNNTLTFGPSTTVTHSSTGGASITSEFITSGTTAVINQGVIRNTGTGTLTISPDAFTNGSGGTVRATAGTLTISNTNITNLTNFAGNTLTGGTWEIQGSATLNFGTRPIATLAAGTTVVFDGATPTFAALDSLTTNNGTLRVLGGKTFTPTAASINNAGTLEVGAGSTFGRALVVQSGGVLMGSGNVAGAVTVQSGGAVAPGASPGILTINNNLTLQSGSTLAVELNGTTVGTEYDRLVVNGTVDVTGATLALTLGFTPQSGHNLFILVNDSNDAITGEFNGLPQGTTINFGTHIATISYVGNFDEGLTIGGNDIVLSIQPVPEPASVLAVALGALAIGGAGRRRVARLL